MNKAQLALAFPPRPALGAADFLPHAGVLLALDYLGHTDRWPERRLGLHGESGAGKTHLLTIWAEEHGAAVIAGRSLQRPFWPESAVAIDDADHAPSEEALLHVLNAGAEARRPILLTASRPLGRGVYRLPDLASRLRATTSVEIGPADDAFLAALFAKLLAERQLAVPPDMQDWLLTRLPRSPAVLREAAGRLDHAALAARVKITPGLAREALPDLLPPSKETTS